MSDSEPGSDTFPLFKMPSLVWEMVILRMGIVNIFTLSFCSDKIYIAVKRLLHRNKNNYELEVRLALEYKDPIKRTVSHTFVVNDASFYIVKTPKNFTRETFTASINGNYFKGFVMDEVMVTYWDDVEIGMRTMISYFTNLFDQNIHHLNYRYSPKTLTSDFEMIDFLLNRQGRIETAEVSISKSNVEFEQLFDRLSTVETLGFKVDLDLQLNVPDGLPWQRDVLYLYNPSWITVPQLLLMNCKRLILYVCKLGDSDVNTYLRHVVNGAVPQLEHLTIEGKRESMTEVLKQLDCKANPNRVLKTAPEAQKAMLTTPMDIRQNDETIATVFYTHYIHPEYNSVTLFFLDVVKPSHTCTGPYKKLGLSSHMM